MTLRPTVCLAGLLSACVFATTGAGKGSEDPPTVQVALNLHSGMPNPTFEISDPDDLSQMRKLIRELPEAVEPETPFFRFGGFRLVADEARCRFPANVTVSKGIVVVRTAAGTRRVFQDTKGLESFLRVKATEAGLRDQLPAL